VAQPRFQPGQSGNPAGPAPGSIRNIAERYVRFSRDQWQAAQAGDLLAAVIVAAAGALVREAQRGRVNHG
jgi:hypothetical protein